MILSVINDILLGGVGDNYQELLKELENLFHFLGVIREDENKSIN